MTWSAPGAGTGGGGLTLEVGGRWLVAHRSELEEWGVSGGVSVEPDATGRGLSLRVHPTWGEAGSGVSRLWEEGVSGGGGGASPGGERVEAELGYGMSAFGGFGVATPYTRFGLGGQERRYGLGWRLARPVGAFEVDVEAYLRDRDTEARPEYGLGLELRLLW